MPTASHLTLRHGRIFPFDSLRLPELERLPVSAEVRGVGQSVDLRSEGQNLHALPSIPPTAALHWAGACFPLYVRAARYDLQTGHVHVTVERPQATQTDVDRWATLHGTSVPRWVQRVLAVVQTHGFQALAPPLVGVCGAAAVLQNGHLLLPALLAGAWGCRKFAPAGLPEEVQKMGALLHGGPVEFDARVCLHTYMAAVSELDAQLAHTTAHAAAMLSHIGQIVDLASSQLTVSYVNQHGGDRPRHGVGLSPREVTLVAGNGLGQGMDWQISGFVRGSMHAQLGCRPSAVALGVSLGLNVPAQPQSPPGRSRRRRRGLPAAPPSLRHIRYDSVTDRLRPLLTELARVTMRGTLHLNRTKTLFLAALWPGLPDILRSCTIRTGDNRCLQLRTASETPSSPHEIILEAPHRRCVGLRLGLSNMMQRRLPGFMDAIRNMPGAPVMQELVDALMPTMGLTVYLKKLVLRPAALLEGAGDQPWAEVHFSLRRMPVLPGCAGEALNRMPGMKKVLNHKVCLSGALRVAHESTAWAVRLSDEQGPVQTQTLHLELPLQVAQGCSQVLATYLAELVNLYPPVLQQILGTQQTSEVDLSMLTSAAERQLQLQVQRDAQHSSVAVHSRSAAAQVSARLDLPPG